MGSILQNSEIKSQDLILWINKWIHQECENIYSSVIPYGTETVVNLDQFKPHRWPSKYNLPDEKKLNSLEQSSVA